MTSRDAVTVTTLLRVAPVVAFDIFTKEVDGWWRREPRFRFRSGPTGRMRFEPGVGGRLLEIYDHPAEAPFEVGRIRIWEPPSRLVFGFRLESFTPDEATEVEVRFEPVGAGTRVTLEHRGWNSLRADHPARHGLGEPAFSSMLGVWWADLLVVLQRRPG